MQGMRAWQPMHATGAQWLTLLRFWLPAYVLGLIAVALVATSRRSHRDTLRLAEITIASCNVGTTKGRIVL